MTSLNRILYVEDDDDIRQVAQLALEEVGGFELKTCSSGSEALSTIDAINPDMVLLDVMMPDMDGVETLEALRQQGSLAGTPVVFMTAKVHPDEVVRYRGIGVFEVIAKPFDPMTLSDEIRSIWERFHE